MKGYELGLSKTQSVEPPTFILNIDWKTIHEHFLSQIRLRQFTVSHFDYVLFPPGTQRRRHC